MSFHFHRLFPGWFVYTTTWERDHAIEECGDDGDCLGKEGFKARICRLMFDVGAVTRHLFLPRDSDLADELHRCCNILKQIRRGDVQESDKSVVDDTLTSAYLLMLSNDGKNYAQLEHAGLDAYVDKFITTRFWEGSETNQGWPLDSSDNSFALWLMWMTLTKRSSFLFFLSIIYRPSFYIRKASFTVAGHSCVKFIAALKEYMSLNFVAKFLYLLCHT